MSEEHTGPLADDDMPEAVWGDGALFDPLSTDSFSQELAGIDESDWGDADLLWGDDTIDVVDQGGEVSDADLLG